MACAKIYNFVFTSNPQNFDEFMARAKKIGIFTSNMYGDSTYDEFEEKAYSQNLHIHNFHFIMKDTNPITPTKRFHTNQVSPLKPNNHDIDMDSDDSESYGLSSNSTTSESTELLNEIGRLKQKLARMEGILSKDDELLNIHILQNEIELLNEKNEGMLEQLSFYE